MIEYQHIIRTKRIVSMAFSIPTSSEIITRSTETLKRFPLTMLSSIIGTLIAIYLIEVEPDKMEGIYLTLGKILLSCSLAIFVFTATRLAGESLKLHWHQILTLLALLGMLAYYMILPDSSKDFSALMVPFRHFFLSLLFAVGFLWAPFARSSLGNGDYWEYSKQVMFAWVISFLFTIIVVLGVNGALFAVEKLFDLDIDSKRYFQIDVFIMGVFSVGYFLSQISTRPLESKQSPNPPRVEKFFTKWLLTPLSGLYFVILYSYTLKVLFTMDWPKGILAWLIVIFSVVAILTYLFWTHFAKELDRGWRKWIWLAVLLQTGMLFVAIGIRIAEYSWTESRYMVFVLGVWLAGVSIYFLLLKNAKIKWIFISMSTLIAITQFGPLNTYIVSKNAQMQRLQNMTVEIKKHKDTAKAPLRLRYEISDALDYLHRRYKGDSLAKIFPKMTEEFAKIKAKREANRKAIQKLADDGLSTTTKLRKERIELSKSPSSLSAYITKNLGFSYINKWEYKSMIDGKHQRVSFSTKENYYPYGSKMIDVRGYDYMARIDMGGYRYTKRGKKAIAIERKDFDNSNLTLFYGKEYQFSISKDDANITIDMDEFLQGLIVEHGKESKDITQESLTIKKKNSHLEIKLELNRISEEYYEDNRTVGFGGMLFIKELK